LDGDVVDVFDSVGAAMECEEQRQGPVTTVLGQARGGLVERGCACRKGRAQFQSLTKKSAIA